MFKLINVAIHTSDISTTPSAKPSYGSLYTCVYSLYINGDDALFLNGLEWLPYMYFLLCIMQIRRMLAHEK